MSGSPHGGRASGYDCQVNVASDMMKDSSVCRSQQGGALK
jgi:hypothetical protein